MIILTMAGAAMSYPIKQAVFSLSGANDYIEAVDHMANMRVRKAMTSVLTGITKVGLTLGAAYLALKPLLDKTSYFNQKPSDVSEFKSYTNFRFACRVIKHNAFVKDSTALRAYQFCAQYFQSANVNDYHLATECILPLFKKSPPKVSDKIFKDPIDLAYRMNFYLLQQGFQNYPSLSSCTKENISKKTTYQLQEKNCKFIKALPDCEKARIDFLKHVYTLENLQNLEKTLATSCLDFWRYDLCKVEIEKINQLLSLEKEPKQ